MLRNWFFISSLFLAAGAFGAYEPQRALNSGTDSVNVGNFPATQAVSASALPLPNGAATSALQSSGNSILTSIANALGGTLATSITNFPTSFQVSNFPSSFQISNFPASQPVTGTFWQATQPVSIAGSVGVTGTFWQATQPVSLSSVPLPTGAATETTLNTLATRTPALGQATMANSRPVVIASDQTPIKTLNDEIYVTGAATQTAIVNNILTNPSGATPTDTMGYKSSSVQIISTATAGTYIFEQSGDGINFVPMIVYNAALANGVAIASAITATSSNILYSFPVRARYIRLRIVTTLTGGSVQTFTRLSQESWSPAVYQVANNTAANLLVTSSGTANTTAQAGTNLSNDVGIQYRSTATGAALVTHIICGASTNAALIKASAGRVLGYTFFNNSASWRYLKFHNVTTAPTVGTTAVVRTVGLPPGQTVDLNLEGGMAHATGISVSITGGAPDNDTTATVANECGADIIYQ